MPCMSTRVPRRLLLTAALFVSADVNPAHGFVHTCTSKKNCCSFAPCRNEFSSGSSSCSSSSSRSSKRLPTNPCRATHIGQLRQLRCAATGDDDGGGLSEKIIQAAKQKLPWEVAAERQGRPVLDLSGGGSGGDDSDLSLSDAVSARRGGGGAMTETENVANDQAGADTDVVDWRNGSVWRETRQALVHLGILSDGGDEIDDQKGLLSSCPQMVRLATEDIVASATFLLDTVGTSQSSIAQNPTILSYPAELFPGALEFLSNIMMLPQPTVSNICKTNPDLLIGALDGYIQEQSVKIALGSAGDALYGVTRSVANDVGKTMRDKREGLSRH